MTSQIVIKRPFRAVAGTAGVPTIIVCENSIIRLGLVHLLSNTNFQVVDFDVTKDVQSLSLEEAPAALIIVGAGPDVGGSARSVEQLRGGDYSAKIVVLSDTADVTAIRLLYRAGADGLLLSTTRHDALIKALELIMMGERLFPSTALLDVTHEIEQTKFAGSPVTSSDQSGPHVLETLSEREREVLARLTKGAQDKVIARDMNLAEATVKVYVKSLLKKLGAQNRTQAAVIAASRLS